MNKGNKNILNMKVLKLLIKFNEKKYIYSSEYAKS